MYLLDKLQHAGEILAQVMPVLSKWYPAIDALVEALEGGKFTQDEFLQMMQTTMLNASDAEMHRELDP